MRNSYYFHEQEQELYDATDNSVKVIRPGTTTLKYTFELPGDIPETVVGLGETGVVYTLQAYIDKANTRKLDFEVGSKRLKVERPLRVVRTLRYVIALADCL